MRKLATFQDPVIARTVCEVLYAENIDSDLREDGDRMLSVWVLAETDVPRAQSILERFDALPNAREFARARERAQRPPPSADEPSREATDAAPRPPVPQAKKSLRQRAKESPVTFTMIGISIAVALATLFGEREDVVAYLSIATFDTQGGYPRWDGWRDVLGGQVWRLVTPIFLHFGLFHLAFNSFWLHDLGGPTERFQGSAQYVGFVLWSAIASNVAQFAFGHFPTFGGLSGFVYALVGYLWARGRADPRSGIYLPGRFVTFFIIWMALGFTGLLDRFIGKMANYCHLGGFVAGLVYGYIAALLARRQRTR
jgi:rhomboid protease GlpG